MAKTPRQCLVEAVDACPTRGHKAFASEHGMSEGAFSKALSGERAYDIDRLAALPPDVLRDFLARYGRERDFVVRPLLRVEQIDDALIRQLDDLLDTYRALARSHSAPARRRVG